jgi:hypothetical protein
MKTKVHKVTILIVDHDRVSDLPGDELKHIIENARYPNRCISPSVMAIETREVEWDDAHPLNRTATWKTAAEDLFARDSRDFRECKYCGKMTRITTAGCDHCDVEDK